MSVHSGPRNLVTLALVLLITGFAGSALYRSLSPAPTFLALQEDYGAAISAAAVKDGPAASSLAELQWDKVSKSARLVEAHGHVLFLCIFLILFAILLNGLRADGRYVRGFAWLGIGGVLLYPAGLLTQSTGHTLLGQVFSAAGAVLILTFAGIMVAGLWWPRIAKRLSDRDHSI